MEKPADLTTHNESQFNSLVDLLQQEKPIWAIAVFDHSSIRDELLESVIGARGDLQPVLLDLSKTQVRSLEKVLKDKIPAELLELNQLTAMIHVANLEGTLLSESLNGEAHLIEDLAENAASLAGSFPAFQTLFWIDRYLWERLQAEAASFLEAADEVFYFFNPRESQKTVNPYREIQSFHSELEKQTEAATTGPLRIKIGRLLEKAHRSPEAQIQFEKALEAANISGDEKVFADSYMGFGHLLMAEQDFMQAMDNYNLALEKYVALEETLLEGEVRNRLARILSQSGEYNKAIHHQKKALAIFKDSEDQREAGLSAKRLAYFLERKGHLDAAAETYGEAAEIYQKLDDAYEMAVSHQQAGAIRQNQQNLTTALTSFQMALESARISENEYLIHALEDSVEELEERLKKKSSTSKNKQTETSADNGRRGFFGKLFGK